MDILEDLKKAKEALQAQDDETALKLYRKLSRQTRLTPLQSFEICLGLGQAEAKAEHPEQAEQHFIAAYHLGVKRSDREMETAALRELAALARAQGNPLRALELYRHELSLWYSKMDRYFSGLSRNYLAQAKIFLDLQEIEEARLYLSHAVTFAATGQDYQAEAEAREQQADLEKHQGRSREARSQYRSALERYRQLAMDAAAKRVEDKMKAI